MSYKIKIKQGPAKEGLIWTVEVQVPTSRTEYMVYEIEAPTQTVMLEVLRTVLKLKERKDV